MKPYPKSDIIPFTTGENLLKSWLQLLPTGPYWEWKKHPESNLYKYWLGVFNQQASIYNEKYYKFWAETSLMRAVDKLPDWETNVGIPSDLFPVEGVSLERRRYNIRSKLETKQLISRIDYINFLSLIGYTLGVDYIDILDGLDGYLDYGTHYNLTYNIEFLSTEDIEQGCFYLILYDGGVDNQNIINILKPLLRQGSTFKQVYI